ncbi:hypothetical protein FVE85_8864 [Porphyridium purpureum]|uniref:Uncharacterized protein n=1 Tax=Porphyridium purpureum TaxID=35688 RepID=A0A5J4YPQ3_PORPP|nr:hypothetical protein FVE85_8864 [Porphyridium purpureum]|eukprot:POR9052..scf296_7
MTAVKLALAIALVMLGLLACSSRAQMMCSLFSASGLECVPDGTELLVPGGGSIPCVAIPSTCQVGDGEGNCIEGECTGYIASGPTKFWTLGERGQSCDQVCFASGACNADVLNFVDTAAKLQVLLNIVDVSCVRFQSSAVSYVPHFETDTGDCVFVRNPARAACDTFQEDRQRICCCDTPSACLDVFEFMRADCGRGSMLQLKYGTREPLQLCTIRPVDWAWSHPSVILPISSLQHRSQLQQLLGDEFLQCITR